MPQVVPMLLVMGGSALGGLGRYLVTIALDGSGFRTGGLPVGVFAVNLLGSFTIALVAALWADRRWVELFVLVGVLGGFTTFSYFSKHTLELLRGGAPGLALGYAGLQVLLCLSAAWLGWLLGAGLTAPVELGDTPPG